VQAVTQDDRKNTLNQQISEDEFKIMDYLGYFHTDGEAGGDGEIDMFEYVECQLLRLNLVPVSQLFQIKKRFIELDSDGGGSIDREEIIDASSKDQARNPKIKIALDALQAIHREIDERKKERAKMSVEQKKQLADETATKALAEIEEMERNKQWSRCYTQAWFKILVTFLVWLAFGLAFYCSFQEWDFWLALYFTLQTGLSVGYGSPSEDDLCYLPDDKIPAAAWQYIKPPGMMYPKPAENGRGGCVAGDLSKLFSTILVLFGSSVIAAGAGIILNAVMNPPGGWYKRLIREEELNHLKQIADESDGVFDDIIIYTKIFFQQGIVRACCFIIIWVSIGILYGCLSNQRMTFLTALYFSVSSMSTGGLEGLKYLGPMTDTPRGAALNIDEFPGGNFAFVSFYLFIGIPMYGWALTEIAGFCTSSVTDKHITDTLLQSINEVCGVQMTS